MTLEEVGSLLGVTGSSIRQVETNILSKLRHPSRARQYSNPQSERYEADEARQYLLDKVNEEVSLSLWYEVKPTSIMDFYSINSLRELYPKILKERRYPGQQTDENPLWRYSATSQFYDIIINQKGLLDPMEKETIRLKYCSPIYSDDYFDYLEVIDEDIATRSYIKLMASGRSAAKIEADAERKIELFLQIIGVF